MSKEERLQKYIDQNEVFLLPDKKRLPAYCDLVLAIHSYLFSCGIHERVSEEESPRLAKDVAERCSTLKA